MEIRIRQARFEDVPTIADFNIAMAQETERKSLDCNTVNSGVASLFSQPELGFYLIAEANSQVVASLMITTEWSDWRNGIFWWIQSVYVLPDFRRQGLFTSLFCEVKNRARRDSNVCGFRLYVERENSIAQSVYRSIGMEKTRYQLFETTEKSKTVPEP